ncbi:MAG: peptidase M23 [Balneolaceae bacterium]|nr:MAG: peptidase M23 [Balneolaceae bacterium]
MSEMLRKNHPVMILPEKYEVLDLSRRYNPELIEKLIRSGKRAVGGYLENRKNMYTAPQYENKRNVHMGVDFWAPAGEPVYAAFPGEVLYTRNNDESGNYGPTIVLRQIVNKDEVFALYGHLSKDSLTKTEVGQSVKPGDVIGWLGNFEENGNWPPHLHYQISYEDPGEADMPGVVSPGEVEKASKIYPNPGLILGAL